jgi:ribosomal protein L3
MLKEYHPEINITYIMTDGAALPIKFSRTVNYLKEASLIDNTITIGHSFGGDFEAVNIYSGLIGAYQVAAADVVVVTMGPGIVGTGTKYGFSGTEQANLAQAASVLGGTAITVPRLSFAADRRRHLGLSHHTITNLGELMQIETIVGLPVLPKSKREIIETQLRAADIKKQHQIFYREGKEVISRLKKLDFKVTTMGRKLTVEQDYFKTAGVAGILAAEKLKGEL